ncbi:MAG TPA: hypothetical protein VGR37_04545, partial [Longimicrobiaceae bacterium]|nr:hypothetical protein [Longimicrobiaceae bacterium]
MHLKHRAHCVLFLSLASAAAACRGAPEGSVVADGILEATEIGVAAMAPGRLVELRVRPGEPVAPGDTVAVLARTETSSEVDAARARVA